MTVWLAMEGSCTPVMGMVIVVVPCESVSVKVVPGPPGSDRHVIRRVVTAGHEISP